MPIINDLQKALKKYRSDGTISVLRALPRHFETKIPANTGTFYIQTEIRKLIHGLVFHSPADPYKIINISVSGLTEYPGTIHRNRGLGQVMAGEWDESATSKIRNDHRYVGFKQRFIDGYNWEETEFYRKSRLKFQQGGGNIEGYTSFEEFEDVRLEYIDNLYQSIREDGYRSNSSNKHQAPSEDIRSNGMRHIHELEPLIAIGRGGELYLCEGFHRVIISKLLDIGSIPVNVLVRHRQWQAIRDEVAHANNPKKNDELRQYLDHPDLQDVLKDQ